MKIIELLNEAKSPLVAPDFVARAIRQHTSKILPHEEIQHEIDRRVKAGEVTLPPGQYSDEAAEQILDQYLIKAFTTTDTPEQFFSSPTMLINTVDQILYNYENDAWQSNIFWNWYRRNQRKYEAAYFRLAGKKSTDSAYIYDTINSTGGDWRPPAAVDPETGYLYPEYKDQVAKNITKNSKK